MGELSDRFAELMARLAKSDAELFRTVGAQNANFRQLLDDLAPGASAVPAPSVAPAPTPAALLASAGLLPPEACELKALKARFGKLVDAQTWLEEQLGPAPKKPTWAVIVQTCRSGAWPQSTSRRAPAPNTLTALALEERLTALERRLEHQLEQRFNRLEALLTVLATALEERDASASGSSSGPQPLPSAGSPPVK
jgi:hypothetical protein